MREFKYTLFFLTNTDVLLLKTVCVDEIWKNSNF